MQPRIAIVHDYLNQFGGAERVVAKLHEIFPSAVIYTSLYSAAKTYPEFQKAIIKTSFLQRLPGASGFFRALLPLYPMAFSRIKIDECEIVISSSSGWAHSVKKPKGAVHICYCYTPARWLWDSARYLERENFHPAIKALLKVPVSLLKRWDRRAASNPDFYVGISKLVANRIRRCYGREAAVIYPPIDVRRFPLAREKGQYYLVVSRLSSYKRVDLAVEACSSLGVPLHVVGNGPQRRILESKASDGVKFLGSLSDDQLIQQYLGCKAVIFAGEEDFGLVPLEANACGKPVIAYAAGGAIETVIDGITGVLFRNPDAESLKASIKRSEAIEFSPSVLRSHAEKFSSEIFASRILEFLEAVRPAE